MVVVQLNNVFYTFFYKTLSVYAAHVQSVTPLGCGVGLGVL